MDPLAVIAACLVVVAGCALFATRHLITVEASRRAWAIEQAEFMNAAVIELVSDELMRAAELAQQPKSKSRTSASPVKAAVWTQVSDDPKKPN